MPWICTYSPPPKKSLQLKPEILYEHFLFNEWWYYPQVTTKRESTLPSKNPKTIPAHPFLFAIASVVSLLFINKTEVQPLVALRLILVMLLVALIGYILFKWIFRNRDKAAFITTVSLVLFSTYGSLYSVLSKTPALAFLAHHKVIITIYLLVLVAVLFLTARMKKPEKSNWPMNLVMFIVLAIPLVQTSVFYTREAFAAKTQINSEISPSLKVDSRAEELPDIYYIILDSYVREDALLDIYEFHNEEFIDGLRDRGFYVADCARSNYAHTRLSLTSSLNMNYLDQLGVNFDPETRDLRSVDPLLKNSAVRTFLAEQGYKTVAFETGYFFTEFKNAETYYTSQTNTLFSTYITPFEYLYLENSVFRIIFDTQTDFMDHYFSKLVFPFTEQEMRVRNVFEKLPKVAEIAGPKFVFVHLDIPHHPFIFLPDGSINPDRRFYPGVYMPEQKELMNEGYLNQIQYVNSEIIPIIDTLLEKSQQKPIIILQGDHGLQAGDRLAILDAIYLPDGSYEEFYSSMSPVNTFRVVFNQFFDLNYPLLQDVSYFSSYEDKMELVKTDETFASCDKSENN